MISTQADDVEVSAAIDTLSELAVSLRRPYLTYAGVDDGSGTVGTESLLLSAHARDTMQRAEVYVRDLSLDPDTDLFSDPIVTIPLPIYREDGARGPQFPSTVPTACWHPLAWLPQAQALPASFVDDDGILVTESRAEWAMRLSLELHATGLYSPERGWVDVLALYGIDVDTDAAKQRLAAWLDGAVDPILDRIDLSRFFAATNTLMRPEWALDTATDMFPAYQAAAWSVAARTLLDDMDEGRIGAAGGTADDFEALLTVAAVAASYLHAVPELDELGGNDALDALCDIIDPIDPDPPADTAPAPADLLHAVSAVRTVLTVVRNAFLTTEQNLAEAEESALADITALVGQAA